MLKMLGRRILLSIPVLLIVSLLVFALLELAPGDVAVTVAGESASPERIAEVREQLGLNEPFITRYWNWLTDAISGDLGRSLTNGADVASTIADRLPVTASLALVTIIMSTVIGLVCGILAALRPKGVVDRVIVTGASIGIAVPSFWAGLVLVLLFAVNRSWFPAIGYAPLTDGWWEWLRHLILPAAALAMLPAAELTQQLRASLTDTMQKDYVLTARAKGMRSRSLVLKHSLKNAAIPVVTVLGFRMAQLLGGTVVIERVFVMPGLGSLAVESVLSRDLVVVQGIVVFTTLIVIASNLLVDASYGYFNPKVRSA